MRTNGGQPTTDRFTNATREVVRRATERLDQEANQAGLDLNELQALLELLTTGGLTRQQASETTGMTEDQTAASLERLQNQGLARQYGPDHTWELTDLGTTFIRRALRPNIAETGALAEALSEEEITRSTAAIRRAVSTLSRRSH